MTILNFLIVRLNQQQFSLPQQLSYPTRQLAYQTDVLTPLCYTVSDM